MKLKDLIGGTIEDISAINAFIVLKKGKRYEVNFAVSKEPDIDEVIT